MSFIERLKQHAEAIKGETYALYLAYRHPGVPWYAKAWTALVVAYAFSPIDLVPDFIPVLGYLDDLLLIPMGIGIALNMIPKAVMEECRLKAQETLNHPHPKRWQGIMIIVVIWLIGLIAATWMAVRFLVSG